MQIASSAPEAQGFDLSKAPVTMRAHVSGVAELALGADHATSPHPANYFPSKDECQGDLRNNVKVNQNCLNISEVFRGFGAFLEDKALITLDNDVGSPFQDRVYVTWTEFNINTGSGYIYAVLSDDYGQTFSQRVTVSTPNTLCPFPLSASGASCDNIPLSQPFTGPDGALYVVFANYNTVNFGTVPPLPPAKFQILIEIDRWRRDLRSAQKVSNHFAGEPERGTALLVRQRHGSSEEGWRGAGGLGSTLSGRSGQMELLQGPRAPQEQHVALDLRAAPGEFSESASG